MNEEELTNQPLPEFIKNCIDDLTAGTLKPEEAYVAMRQYKPLRDILDIRKEEVAGKLANPEEITKLFVEILGNELALAGKRPEALDDAKPPAEIAARAASLVEAEGRTNQAIKNKLTNLEAERKTYARKVTSAWVAELRNRRIYNVQPEKIEETIFSATEKIPAATSREKTMEILSSTVSTAIEKDAILSPHREALRAVTQTIEPPEVFIQAAAIREQTNRIILDTPDVARPDLLVTFVAGGVETKKAVSLTRVAEAMSLDINPAIDPTRPSVFFQAVASNGLQKLAAPAVDAILTVLPQGTREQIIETVLTKSWERVTQNLDQKFGEAVVSSPLFKQAIEHGNRTFAKPTAPGGAAAGIAGFFGDAATTVFGSGIDQAMIDKYLELGKRTTITPGKTIGAVPGVTAIAAPAQTTFLQFYTAFAAVYRPELFHTAYAGGKWLLDYVGTKAVKRVAGKVITSRLSTMVGGALGSVLGPVGTVIGGFVGTVLGDKVLGGVINGAKSLISNVLGSGFFQRIFSGEPGRWQDDFPLVAAIVVIFPAIILVLLFQFLNNASQTSPLADFEFGIGVGGPGGPPIDCTQTPDIPECKLTQCQGDCRWPLDTSTHACISEGPFVGTHSQNRLSAVDFLTPNQGRLFGAPVYTQYAGVVQRSSFGYLDNSGYFGNQDGGTYGNHVVVLTDSGTQLLFAHLRNIQTVNEGSRVTAGTVVGFVDHTGYSGGVHLHYEARKPGDINAFLPFPVPPCGSVQDCDVKLKKLGHSACL